MNTKSKVPAILQVDSLTEYLEKNDLTRIHQGKVRDTYTLPSGNLLVVATDRISISDFVLNALIPKKGEVLSALVHFWLNGSLKEFPNHLIFSSKNPKFNAAYDLLEKMPELPIERCLVVKNFKGSLYPFEMIFRHYIGGSVFKEYETNGKAGGQDLPPNLPKWSKLEKPIFTPSTKEEVGHDINVNADYFFKTMEEKGLNEEAHQVVEKLIRAYMIVHNFLESKGILLLDTKLEVAGHIIVDEMFTPDSSRFTRKADWEKIMAEGEGKDPQFMDKQTVRNWGNTVETPFHIIGINKLDPEIPAHVAFVHDIKVPDKIIEDTAKLYLEIFQIITGQTLAEYQEKEMGVLKLQNQRA